MWRMQSGNRVLSPAEWQIFVYGLGIVRDSVEEEIEYECNDFDTGVAVFDRCSSEQKLALLADVAKALSDPVVPCPKHTAANEAAVAAVLRQFWTCLEMEVEQDGTDYHDGDGRYRSRQLLLSAFADENDCDDLPSHTESDLSEWSWVYEELEERIFWDEDFAMADDLLDLPPEQMESTLQLLTIDREYFVSVPREPNESELVEARNVLARMLGLPATDEFGCYRLIEDYYHGLRIGPCSAEEITQWENHPWTQLGFCKHIDCDCDYESWTLNFVSSLPKTPYVLDLDPNVGNVELPSGISTELLGSNWVIRDEHAGRWCGLVNNCWTDELDEDNPLLTFATEQDAKLAYLHADQMYSECALRRKSALELLGIPDSDE